MSRAPSRGCAGLPGAYPLAFRALVVRMVHPDPDTRPTIADAAAALLQLRRDAWVPVAPPPPPARGPVAVVVRVGAPCLREGAPPPPPPPSLAVPPLPLPCTTHPISPIRAG